MNSSWGEKKKKKTSCSAVIEKFVMSAVALSARSNNIFSLLSLIPQSIL
jgi:hypothetical protein